MRSRCAAITSRAESCPRRIRLTISCALRAHGSDRSRTDGTGAPISRSAPGARVVTLARGCLREVLQRCCHTAGRERHTCRGEAHLDAAQRAGEHQIVEVTKMPDPEDMTFEPAEAGAERHVEAIE